MEACMVKPEPKKRNKPKPTTAPPEPPRVRRFDQGRPENTEPVLPPPPLDAELGQTQSRVKRMAAAINEANENMKQHNATGKPSETPVLPPRPADRKSKQSNQPEAAAVPTDEQEIIQITHEGPSGIFHRSQKEKTPMIRTYRSHNFEEEEKMDDIPVKQAPNSKPGGLKGVMKGLYLKPSPKTSRDPSPDLCSDETKKKMEQVADQEKQEIKEEPKQEKGGFFAGVFKKSSKPADEASARASRESSPEASTEEAGTEKEQSADKNKHEKNAEPKQEKGIFGGMFRKTPKEKSSPSPALTVSKAESDEEEEQEEEKKSEQAHGGFFSNILKKSHKPAEETSAQENLSGKSELSASSDSLSENKEKGGIFGAMFKKSPKPQEDAQTDQDQQSLHGDLSASNDSLSENSSKERGFFGKLRKTPKTPGEGTSVQDKDSLQAEKSSSKENLTENNTKEKGGVLSGMFKKSPKLSEGSQLDEAAEPLKGELSASNDSLSENKEKGGLLAGFFKKTPKTTAEDTELTASNENLSDNKQEKSGGLLSGLHKKTPKASGDLSKSQEPEIRKELSASNDGLSENSGNKEKNIFSHMFKRPQKSTESLAADKDSEESSDKLLSGSSENLTDPAIPKEKKGAFVEFFKSNSIEFDFFDEEKPGLLSGLTKKAPKVCGEEDADEDKASKKGLSASADSLIENSKEKNFFSGMFKKAQKPADEESSEGKKLSASCENLVEGTTKEKTGGFAALFKKSPKPSPRSLTTQDPLSDSIQRSDSLDSLTETGKEDLSAELLSSNENLDAPSTKQEIKSAFGALFRRTPKNEEQQDGEEAEPPRGGMLRRKRTIKKKQRVVSFRVKQTLPRFPKRALQSSDRMEEIEEAVEALELQDLNPAQDSTVEVQPVEMAAFPTEENPVESNAEHNELMEWWGTVKGWTEWNETTNFEDENEEIAMEQAADRVFMAARLFVHLFNQRGASLQHRILELLALADAADHFHKKTTSAAVGGGVASVAGSITTITGLILAPFTFGASIIVTAVGIGVATAGSIASATANITDTVHSNMDRKKLEKMIQDYQEEIKDIRECLEFVQEGMDTLQEWDFEKFSQSAASKAMNHNIKHVMKEGGRAGKALMINTDKLISTVQVLGAAGGVAKAAQAISVTTGVMSALFLALDIFFLAKDSHKLRKGAKTKFASKIRDVCKDLQDGLLELNKVKTQLQKTMDGIEVEEFEEFEEVEVEVEDDLESDPKKLAELEEELDILEENLDRKLEEEQRKVKEMESEKAVEKTDKEMIKEEEEEEEERERKEKEKRSQSESQSTDEEEKNSLREDNTKEVHPAGSKKEKEIENWATSRKDKPESNQDKSKEMHLTGKGGTSRSEDSSHVIKSLNVQGEPVKPVRSESRHSSREEDGGLMPVWTSTSTERDSENRSTRRHSSRSDRSSGEDRGGFRAEWKSAHTERESENSSTRRHSSRSSKEDEGEMRPKWKSMNKERESESKSTRRHSSRSDREDEKGGKYEVRPSAEEKRSYHHVRDSDRSESWRRREEEERGKKDWRTEEIKSGEEHSWKERKTTRWSHHEREHGGETRTSRVESTRQRFEEGGGELEEGRSRENRDSGRRGSERGQHQQHHHHHHHHQRSRRGSRPRADALKEDGLNI